MGNIARRLRGLLIISCILAANFGAHAVQPGEALNDPALEARARALSKGLRCMVCQNQSIDDSDAPLARDLRVIVRQRLNAGYTDDEIREFLVARYGEFALLEPRVSLKTLALWLTPLLMLGIGGGAVWIALQRRTRSAPEALSPDEKRRIAELE